MPDDIPSMLLFSFKSQNELSQELEAFEGEDFSRSDLHELSVMLTKISASSLSMRVRERSIGRTLPRSEDLQAVTTTKNNPQLAIPGLEVDELGRKAIKPDC